MSNDAKHLLGLSKADLEGMCVDCGLCCHASVPLSKGNIVVPDLRCKHLQIEKSTGESCCSVYENRHEVAEWCLPLTEAIAKGVFPKECPYVKDVKSYVGSAVLSDQAYKSIKPHLQKALVADGKPSWISDSHWEKFLEQ